MSLKLVQEYTAAGRPLPPDPLPGDLCVHRVIGEDVYSVLPMTNDGRAFCLEHVDSGYAAGDMLIVPAKRIVAFCDELFDRGLVVV